MHANGQSSSILKVRAYINEMPQEDEYEHTIYNSVEGKPQVVVVGAVPADCLQPYAS